MPTTRGAIGQALASDAFTWAEKKILEWQFGGREGHSDEGFWVKLVRALAHADTTNEARLLDAFPELADAWRSFRYSPDFGAKCAAHGIDL